MRWVLRKKIRWSSRHNTRQTAAGDGQLLEGPLESTAGSAATSGGPQKPKTREAVEAVPPRSDGSRIGSKELQQQQRQQQQQLLSKTAAAAAAESGVGHDEQVVKGERAHSVQKRSARNR